MKHFAHKTLHLLSAAVVLTATAAGTARAADHYNLEENLPTQVEDAYPIAFGGREIQGFARYENTTDGKDLLTLQPRLEFGFAPNWQATIEAPFLLGGADHEGSGDVDLSALYNFNQETTLLPAFAASGLVTLPTGDGSDGFDTRLRLIATKTLGTSSGMDRLHLNIDWNHNAARDGDERANRFDFILGYSRRIGPDAALVLDFVREQQPLEHEDANIVEAGLRWSLTPSTVFSIGAGAGIGDDSPNFRTTVGLQFTF